MERRLIFFDIDGTLLDHRKELPESTIQAVHQLKQAGHEVAIATGRAPFAFKEIRERLGIESFVSMNGQYVVYQGKVIHKNPIEASIVQSLTEFAALQDHPLLYMDEEDMKLNVVEHERIIASYVPHKMDIPTYDPKYYLGRDIYQCILFCTEEEEARYLEGFTQSLKFVRWGEVAADVLPTGGSKAAGIAKFVEHTGFEREEVIAFGDHLNDLEMLAYVGHGVAMGNALDAVKRIARYTTKDVGDDGVAYGLLQLGLI
ncbi:Cof-type HAD-IIB family hydrolase [Paenibacillus tuaregi]|uniref:Cof-type HAD-IIB family hydrolase n=1 Tax=Paenibacillus tuaregi TaxID=1816681 RepID=UPI000838B27B|nr:Cof-type HAD-IIB family hydrolase [Paenibacillus tuaregi]